MAWCGQEARGEAVEISGNLGGAQKVMKAVVLPIRNENQKGLCAWDPHRALLCSFNTRKNIFHFAISLVITEKKSLHSILDIMCMIRQ